MRRWILALLLIASSCSCFAQIDTSKWLPLDNLNNNLGDCLFATQDTVSGGYLSLSANSGTFSCAGLASGTREAGFVVSKAFSFTYGVAKARIRFGAPGNHIFSSFWMWGGPSGSLGYPSTCVANMAAGGAAGVMAICEDATTYTDTEIDIAESSASTNINTALITWTGGTGTNHGCTIAVAGAEDAYHIYELDWFPNSLVFRIDGAVVCTLNFSISVPMFLQFDQEPGRTAPDSYPAVTSVDWIRVCSDPNAYCNPGDPTMIFDDEFNEGVVTTPVNHAVQGQTVQGGSIQ